MGEGADELGAKEAIQLRREKKELEQQLADLKSSNDTLKAAHEKLLGEHDTITTEHAKLTKKADKAFAELGTFKGNEARKAKLAEVLALDEIKSKVRVDSQKAMDYLADLPFDETALDKQVRKAVELFGVPIDRTNSGLGDGGAGAGSGQPGKTKGETGDPLGDLVRGTVPKG